MPFPFSALIPLGGALIDAISTHSANKKSMKFMQRQSETEWQRGTKDMIAAGINPMLAVSQGGNSSVTARAEPITRNTATTAATAMMTAQQLKNMSLQNNLLQEQVEQAKLETDAKKVFQGYGGGRNLLTEQQWEQTELLKQQRLTAAEQARLAKTNVEIRELEKKLLSSTMASSISSAKSAAELAEKEVTFKEIQTILMNLDIPEKEAMAKWFTRVGEGSPAAKATMTIGQWMKMIFGGK